MARYIDADLFCGWLETVLEDFGEPNISIRPIAFGTQNALRSVYDVIKKQPTADVQDVKHGEWLPVQYTYFGLKRYECSECKDDEYWQKRYIEHKEKYCPNCGAKMDGGKEE